jgi:hypothetical protein
MVANSSQHDEESSLNLAASNAPIYERRQRERREPRLSLDEQVASAAENKSGTTLRANELWWAVAAFVIIGVAFIAVLLVN